MKSVLALLLLSVSLLFSQVTTTAPLDGNVVDPQGAAVVGAEVVVVNTNNGQTLKTTSDERGHWILPAMPSGTYRVTVTVAGFRTLSIEGVKVDAGVPATVTARLEVGQVSERIDVQAGADLVQTTSASLSSTIEGRQIFELPFTSRNVLELLVTQAGTQTGTTARNTFINGLPFAATNITIDGINTQDNYYKSGDGFFTLIPVRPDSVQEVTLTTSAAGVDSGAQGAAQIKFVTKGGTNEFHGGAFWQHRNTVLNSNYYFNNINKSPRDKIILNQGGFRFGGPILKNKLFFFTSYELFRLPISTSTTRTVMKPAALDGTFTRHGRPDRRRYAQADRWPDRQRHRPAPRCQQQRLQPQQSHLPAGRHVEDRVRHHQSRLQHQPKPRLAVRLDLLRERLDARHYE
jgi:hypothetical protein